MLSLNVYNYQGETVGTVEVDPSEFGGKINKQLLHDVVLMYLANQRAGTHSTLRRGEVAGILKALKLTGLTCLVGTAENDPAVYKSARNIRGVEVQAASQFNTYSVLRPKRLLLTRAALEALRKPRASGEA